MSGAFVSEIPRRLGQNAALDAATDALVAAFTPYRAGSRRPTLHILSKHGKALEALRCCLGKPSTAHAPETLCAIQLMMIYQV